MLGWEQIAQKYTIDPFNKVKKITMPLKERLAITCFFYIRVNYQGQLVWFGNRPDCTEHYVDQKHFIDDPCMCHPDNWEPGYSLLETVAPNKYQQTFLEETKNLFNLNSWIILCKKNLEFMELFGFVGETKTHMEKIYLNHLSLLKSFATHFKKEMHPNILQMAEAAISLVDLKGNSFNSTCAIHPTIETATHRAFLKDCGFGALIQRTDSLSPRERQCVKSLLLGKSAKVTAADLKLSSRTIEFYFENIKNKFGCFNKAEVFSLSKKLEEIGLL